MLLILVATVLVLDVFVLWFKVLRLEREINLLRTILDLHLKKCK